MRGTTLAGVVLLVLGLLILAFGGFSFTREEEVLDVGPIEATAERRETVPISPILGGIALASGLLLIAAGARRRP